MVRRILEGSLGAIAASSEPLLRHPLVDGAVLDLPQELVEVVGKFLFFPNAAVVHDLLLRNIFKAFKNLMAEEGLSL